MATSVEKVHELVAGYAGAPSPNAGPAELGIRSLLTMGIVGPHLLPDDPAELDGLLDYLAAQCLLKRSDDAAAPELVYQALAEPAPLELEPPDADVVA